MDTQAFYEFFAAVNFKETFTASMILFAVIDIVGSIPIIVDLRRKVGHIQSEKASVVAGILMIIFMFVGEQMLGLIGMTDPSEFKTWLFDQNLDNAALLLMSSGNYGGLDFEELNGLLK